MHVVMAMRGVAGIAGNAGRALQGDRAMRAMGGSADGMERWDAMCGSPRGWGIKGHNESASVPHYGKPMA
jgi:hypothetical protein